MGGNCFCGVSLYIKACFEGIFVPSTPGKDGEGCCIRSQFRLLRTLRRSGSSILLSARGSLAESVSFPLHSSEGCHGGEMSSTRRALMQSDVEAHRGARRASRSTTAAAIGTSVPIISSNITSSVISERKRPASDQKLDVSSEKGRALPIEGEKDSSKAPVTVPVEVLDTMLQVKCRPFLGSDYLVFYTRGIGSLASTKLNRFVRMIGFVFRLKLRCRVLCAVLCDASGRARQDRRASRGLEVHCVYGLAHIHMSSPAAG